MATTQRTAPTTKAARLDSSTVDIGQDIALINQYTLQTLSEEDVFAFRAALCDNLIDRDFERFTEASLDTLRQLFIGKTGISDHYWSASNQVARIYKTEIEVSQNPDAPGGSQHTLIAYAYIPRDATSEDIIAKITGGIIKEVSVGCQIKTRTCSICGERIRYRACSNDHEPGREYDDQLCWAELEEPTDAFEFSFVAVPAQRGAGVTKSFEDIGSAIVLLLSADLSGHGEALDRLSVRIAETKLAADELDRRKAILEENAGFLPAPP